MKARGPKQRGEETIKVHCPYFRLHCHPLDKYRTKQWWMCRVMVDCKDKIQVVDRNYAVTCLLPLIVNLTFYITNFCFYMFYFLY